MDVTSFSQTRIKGDTQQAKNRAGCKLRSRLPSRNRLYTILPSAQWRVWNSTAGDELYLRWCRILSSFQSLLTVQLDYLGDKGKMDVLAIVHYWSCFQVCVLFLIPFFWFQCSFAQQLISGLCSWPLGSHNALVLVVRIAQKAVPMCVKFRAVLEEENVYHLHLLNLFGHYADMLCWWWIWLWEISNYIQFCSCNSDWLWFHFCCC